MTNTNVPVVLGTFPPTWAGTVRFYPQAIPNVIFFVLLMAWTECYPCLEIFCWLIKMILLWRTIL
jgi:hypothetical protein